MQIFVHERLYYAKDLTGKVNGRPIVKKSVLVKGAELSLTSRGSNFIFHGDGFLSEIG